MVIINEHNNQKDDLENTVGALKALAHPLRLAIVKSLQSGALCVSEIENQMGSTQSNISQHLSILKKQNILKSKREKNQIYYYVDNWRVFQFISMAKEIFGDE